MSKRSFSHFFSCLNKAPFHQKAHHYSHTIHQSRGAWRQVQFERQPKSSSRILPLLSPSRLGQSAKETLCRVFLPQGYPSTTSQEYVRYSTWQFCNSLSGTISNTLSTQALLQALGMGAGTAVGIAATTHWIVKDGFGLLGGVLYAGMVSNKFDSYPKKYRFLATCAIQLATFAELLTPLIPHSFLLMASLSNVGKNVGWLAAGATRAAFHRGFTRADNLGDLTAKAGVQNTAAGLIGTGLGIGLSVTLGTEPIMLITAFIPLCAINLWTAYQTNMSVVTRTMNVERAELALYPFTHQLASRYKDGSLSQPLSSLHVLLSPEQVALDESFILPQTKHYAIPLYLNVDIQRICQQLSPKQVSILQECLTQDPLPYRICVLEDSSQASVYVWFLDTSDAKAILMGFFHACLVRSILTVSPQSLSDPHLLSSTWSHTQAVYPIMYKQLEQLGWDLSHSHLCEGLEGRIKVQ